MQLHKVMLDAALSSSLDGALNFETEGLVMTALTRDNLEGTKAFFEKREPRFTGGVGRSIDRFAIVLDSPPADTATRSL